MVSTHCFKGQLATRLRDCAKLGLSGSSTEHEAQQLAIRVIRIFLAGISVGDLPKAHVVMSPLTENIGKR